MTAQSPDIGAFLFGIHDTGQKPKEVYNCKSRSALPRSAAAALLSQGGVMKNFVLAAGAAACLSLMFSPADAAVEKKKANAPRAEKVQVMQPFKNCVGLRKQRDGRASPDAANCRNRR